MADGAQILIEARPLGVRRALLDADGIPAALDFFDDVSVSAMDALFLARVTGFDDASDLAFLDLDSTRSGVLPFRRARMLKPGSKRIRDCLTEGQMLTVQALADPSALETKAVPVTPRPRLVGRYVVVEAGTPKLTLSKSLTIAANTALKEALSGLAAKAAIVVRDRAENVDPEVVVAEVQRLLDHLNTTRGGVGVTAAMDPLERAIATAPTGVPIGLYGTAAYADARQFVQNRYPDCTLSAVSDRDWADADLDGAIDEALAERIRLPSGGWIAIYPTPALTAIDVNMGTALQTYPPGEAKAVVNMEAAQAVAFHLRFQNIGGLIVVDFIDMTNKHAVKALIETVDAALSEDTVPVDRTGISRMGVMELTRQRRGLSLRDRFQISGRVQDRPAATADMLLAQAEVESRTAGPGTLQISAPARVTRWLEAHPGLLGRLSKRWGRALTFKTANTLSVDVERRA